ncbi:MAG: hypothetical protein ACRD3W_32515 [Terriglobales bacterium]
MKNTLLIVTALIGANTHQPCAYQSAQRQIAFANRIALIDQTTLAQTGFVLNRIDRTFPYLDKTSPIDRTNFALAYDRWLRASGETFRASDIGHMLPYDLRLDWAISWWQANSQAYCAQPSLACPGTSLAHLQWDPKVRFAKEALLDAGELLYRARQEDGIAADAVVAHDTEQNLVDRELN